MAGSLPKTTSAITARSGRVLGASTLLAAKPVALLAAASLMVVLLAAAVPPLPASAAVQEVDPASQVVDLKANMTVLEDPLGLYSVEDVAKLPPESFASLNSYLHGSSMGVTNSIYWVRMDLENPADAYLPRIIEYRQTWTRDVQFFVVEDGAVVDSLQTGTRLPFDNRPLKNRFFAFPVNLHHGVNTYYFRLHSYMPLILDFSCYQAAYYEDSVNTDTLLVWIFYGALLVLIILNTLMFMVARARSSLYFVLFMSAFFLFLTVFDSTGFKYLWPANTWWEARAFPVTLILASIMYAVFFAVYTDSDRHNPWLARSLAVMSLLGLTAILWILASPPGYYMIVLQPLLLVLLLAILVLCSWFWRRYRERSALYFLGTYALLMIVTMLNTVQGMGLLPEDIYSHFGMHAGIICVGLVLNLGMANRIKQAVDAQADAEMQLRAQFEDLRQLHTELETSLARTETLNDQLTTSQEELLGAHEQLHRQERRIQTIFDRAPISMSIIDGQGFIKEANQMSAVLFGHGAPELIGKDIKQFILDEPAEEFQDKLEAVLKNDISSFYIQRAYAGRSGDIHWGDTYVTALYDKANRPAEIIIAISDISEKKSAEDALAASEHNYRTVVENAGEIIVVLQNQLIKFINPHVEKVLGQTREELAGANILELLCPDDHAAFLEHERRLLEGAPSAPFIFRLYDREGGLHFLESLGVPIEWEGRPANLIFSLDVTDKILATREMSNLQNLLAGFFDSMPSVLVGVSPQGLVNLWNRAAIRLTGRERSEALDQPVEKVLPVSAKFQLELNRALRGNSLQTAEKIDWTRNGEKTFLDAVIYPVNTEELAGVVVRIDDITEKVRLEETIVQTEKMLSVGGLAAGMAHEINNPLGGILQGTQNVKRRLSGNLPINHTVAEECGTSMEIISRYLEKRHINEILDGIRDSGTRASSIVQNMLQFSRLSQSFKEPRPLHELVERTLRLAASDYDLERKYDFKHIEIAREYDPQIPAVYCIVTEIEQVILNLLKNAAQAVFTQSDHPLITIRTFQEEGWVVLWVEDNGPGMDEPTMRRIFEPFYTTKEPGSGTGLGLSVSYFIVTNNHNGQMMVESTPGQGARFIVRLPVASPLI